MRGGEMELPRVRTRRRPRGSRVRGRGRVGARGTDGSAGEAGGGDEEAEEEQESLLRTRTLRGWPSARPLPVIVRVKRGVKLVFGVFATFRLLSLFFFEGDEAGLHLFLPLARQAVGWDLLLLC